MVAVDDAGKPVPVPPLRPFSPKEKQRFEAAEARKALRLEHARRFAETHNPVDKI